MFEGSFSNSVDEKGRIAVPAKFREVLRSLEEDRVMLTWHFVHPSPCLDLWPTGAWRELKAKLQASQGAFGMTRSLFGSVYIGQVQPCQLDKQGRILVPQSLRERAELGEEVTFVGSGEMVRVFGSRAYDGIVDVYQRMMRENPDALGDLGI